MRCLSPNSATLTRLRADDYMGSGRERVVTVDSPRAADQAFEAMFKK